MGASAKHDTNIESSKDLLRETWPTASHIKTEKSPHLSTQGQYLIPLIKFGPCRVVALQLRTIFKTKASKTKLHKIDAKKF
jgi:hypothetical protein